MEAPDEVTCVCGVKWRRKPGVAGYLAINSATLPPSLKVSRKGKDGCYRQLRDEGNLIFEFNR
ncbi:hypothetical protein E4W36_26575 [Klebsiella pneumoniae]|nr:hypothetical protein [Klebsiella pneumoniae]